MNERTARALSEVLNHLHSVAQEQPMASCDGASELVEACSNAMEAIASDETIIFHG